MLMINAVANATARELPWTPALATRAASNSADVPGTIPTFISLDEAYYWSVPWQEDVREAMAARTVGESVVFDSDDPNDVIRWLLSVDDGNE